MKNQAKLGLGGWDAEQSVVFGHALKQRGCHFMHVSSAGISPLQQIPVGPNYQVPLALARRRETRRAGGRAPAVLAQPAARHEPAVRRCEDRM
jgi:hypothetical protein